MHPTRNAVASRTPRTRLAGAWLLAALLAGGLLLVRPARADDTPAPPPGPKASEQVIDPQVDRREVRVPHIPSRDFEAGLYTGTYDTQNFGASLVVGLRLGYHITEDIFVEGDYGVTRVSDTDFRNILPGGIFPTPHQNLRYFDLLAGYNVLPGEIFLGRTHAKVTAVYVVAGVGSTKFDALTHQTVDVGGGMRVFLTQWAALQADVRDHIFTLDLLGTRQTTQNLEVSLGATFFF